MRPQRRSLRCLPQRRGRVGKHRGARLAETPGPFLWIESVEATEEFGIGEVQEAGGVVSHDVGLAGDVGDLRAVAVMALVGALEATEVGRGVTQCHLKKHAFAFGLAQQCGLKDRFAGEQ